MSLEEKYAEVRQLIEIGKEKGYLLHDEVNELLPPEITTSDAVGELFTAFGNAGIEVVDSEQKYRKQKLLDRRGEGLDDVGLDLAPSAIDKTYDPFRMYLREGLGSKAAAGHGCHRVDYRLKSGHVAKPEQDHFDQSEDDVDKPQPFGCFLESRGQSVGCRSGGLGSRQLHAAGA